MALTLYIAPLYTCGHLGDVINLSSVDKTKIDVVCGEDRTSWKCKFPLPDSRFIVEISFNNKSLMSDHRLNINVDGVGSCALELYDYIHVIDQVSSASDIVMGRNAHLIWTPLYIDNELRGALCIGLCIAKVSSSFNVDSLKSVLFDIFSQSNTNIFECVTEEIHAALAPLPPMPQKRPLSRSSSSRNNLNSSSQLNSNPNHLSSTTSSSVTQQPSQPQQQQQQQHTKGSIWNSMNFVAPSPFTNSNNVNNYHNNSHTNSNHHHPIRPSASCSMLSQVDNNNNMAMKKVKAKVPLSLRRLQTHTSLPLQRSNSSNLTNHISNNNNEEEEENLNVPSFSTFGLEDASEGVHFNNDANKNNELQGNIYQSIECISFGGSEVGSIHSSSHVRSTNYAPQTYTKFAIEKDSVAVEESENRKMKKVGSFRDLLSVALEFDDDVVEGTDNNTAKHGMSAKKELLNEKSTSFHNVKEDKDQFHYAKDDDDDVTAILLTNLHTSNNENHFTNNKNNNQNITPASNNNKQTSLLTPYSGADGTSTRATNAPSGASVMQQAASLVGGVISNCESFSAEHEDTALNVNNNGNSVELVDKVSKTFEEKIEKLTDEYESFKSQSNTERAQYKSSIDELQAKIDNLHKIIIAKEEVVSNLENNLKAAENSKLELQNVIRLRVACDNDSQAEIQAIRDESKFKSDKIDTLENSLQACKQELTRVKEDNAQTQIKLCEVTADFAEVRKTLAGVRKSAAQSSIEVRNASRRSEDAEEALKAAQLENSHLKTELNSLKMSSDQSESAIKSLKTELTEAKICLDQSEKENKMGHEEQVATQQLKSIVLQQISVINMLRSQLEEANLKTCSGVSNENAVLTLTEENKSLMHRVEFLTQERDNLALKIKNIIDFDNLATFAVEELKNGQADCSKKQNAEQNVLTTHIADLQSEVSGLQGQISALNSRNSTLVNELKNLTSQSNSSSESLRDAEFRLLELRSFEENLRSEANELRTNFEERGKELRMARSQNRQLRSYLDLLPDIFGVNRNVIRGRLASLEQSQGLCMMWILQEEEEEGDADGIEHSMSEQGFGKEEEEDDFGGHLDHQEELCVSNAKAGKEKSAKLEYGEILGINVSINEEHSERQNSKISVGQMSPIALLSSSSSYQALTMAHNDNNQLNSASPADFSKTASKIVSKYECVSSTVQKAEGSCPNTPSNNSCGSLTPNTTGGLRRERSLGRFGCKAEDIRVQE